MPCIKSIRHTTNFLSAIGSGAVVLTNVCFCLIFFFTVKAKEDSKDIWRSVDNNASTAVEIIDVRLLVEGIKNVRGREGGVSNQFLFILVMGTTPS